MTHTYTRLFRWSMVSVLFLMAVGCNNPKVYFSTSTTVGLEATPPTSETPPHITFGYKRAEIALVPVPKLKEPQGNSDKGSSDSSSAQPQDKPQQPMNVMGKGEPGSQSAEGTPGGPGPRRQSIPTQLKEPSSSEPHGSQLERGCSKTPTSPQSQNVGNSTRSEDALSVLASFHLALNWFGPAKIEQHFATGCAATNLIKGITEEEEEKANAKEAAAELNQGKRLLDLTERNINRLAEEAAALEKKANDLLKDVIETNRELENRITTGSDADQMKKRLKGLDENALTIRATGARLTWEADALKLKRLKDSRDADGMQLLVDAEEKALTAIKKADKAARNQEFQQQSQQTKDDANQLITKITDRKPILSGRVNETLKILEKVQNLVDVCRGKIGIPDAT